MTDFRAAGVIVDRFAALYYGGIVITSYFKMYCARFPVMGGRIFCRDDCAARAAPAGQRLSEQLVLSFSEYWHSPLGPFYCDFSHRLVIYLLVGVAYVIGSFACLIIFINPAWVYGNLAYSAARALHTALFFTLGLAVVDVAASRLLAGKYNYKQRTVGGQWQIMLAAFLLAFLLLRISFASLVGVYAQWVLELYKTAPQNRMSFAAEFLIYFAGWLITAGLVIQFALRSQRLAAAPQETQSSGVPDSRDDDRAAAPQARSGFFVHSSANQNLKIPFTEITHISVEDHYCRMIHKNGENLDSHILRMTLNQLENELPGGQFVRIHRSHIVNLEHVTGWRMVRQQRRLVMDHGARLPISRSRLAELKQIMDRLGLPKLK